MQTQSTQQATACHCHQDQHQIHRPADCPQHGTAALRARLEQARRTRHQVRLVADGKVIASGPWRSDHLAAVCDRRRMLDHVQEHGTTVGQAEISTMVIGVAS